jgi:hypothetical protein
MVSLSEEHDGSFHRASLRMVALMFDDSRDVDGRLTHGDCAGTPCSVSDGRESNATAAADCGGADPPR